MLGDQAAPGVINSRHMFAVGLFFLPLPRVFPLGDGGVEETSSCGCVESKRWTGMIQGIFSFQVTKFGLSRRKDERGSTR